MEDRIRRLCAELLGKKKGDEEIGPILVELQGALHLHIERLRERFSAYPFLVERRNRISPPEQDQGATAKESKPTDLGS